MPDFARLFTQTGKFKVMPVVAHHERMGQFKPGDPNRGATLAAPNKVLFCVTVHDAQELAPEFAEKPGQTESRREASLVVSSKPVEDLWERGHPNSRLMQIRSDYFWIVDRLRMYPQAVFFPFPVERIGLEGEREYASQLDADKFIDWVAFRSSMKQLKEGIVALNRYYYECMLGVEVEDLPERILKIIECWGGVLGMRRAMEPFILLDEFKVNERINDKIYDLFRDIMSSRSDRPFEAMPDPASPQFTPELIGIYSPSAQFLSIAKESRYVEDFADWEYVALPKGDFPWYTFEQQIAWWQKQIIGEEREHLRRLIDQIIQSRHAPEQGVENVTRAREQYSDYLIREENRWDKAHEIRPPPDYSYANVDWEKERAAKLGRKDDIAAWANFMKGYSDKLRREGLERRMGSSQRPPEVYSKGRWLYIGQYWKPLTEEEEERIKRDFELELDIDDKVYERR